MNSKITPNDIYDILFEMFPNAKAELDHTNVYELTIAVILSAQTTDIAVNKVTPALFHAYPDLSSLSKAKPEEVEQYIKTIGLYRNKAKSIVAFAKEVLMRYDGIIPNTLEELKSLPGVGQKTANVVLSVWYHIPAIAVDTHVFRVSKRLRLAYQNDSVEKVEARLKKKFDQSQWGHLHHLLIFFGRYFCKAQSPNCQECPFKTICYDYKHHYSKNR